MLRRIDETLARAGSSHNPGNKRGGPGFPMITAINSIDLYAIMPIGAYPFIPALFAFLVANANCVIVHVISLLAKELPFPKCGFRYSVNDSSCRGPGDDSSSRSLTPESSSAGESSDWRCSD